MTDLLVVSHACFMAINRHVYRLFAADGWKVELVAPEELQFPNGKRKAEARQPEDPVIHYLPLVGNNPRTYRFDGLQSLLDEKKPAVVLLDNDPVSKMSLEIGKWCRANQSKLFCISCENLPLDVVSTVKRRGWKSLPAAVVKRLLLNRTKAVVDGVFTINSDGKNILKAEGYRQVEKMPLGFDPAYFFINPSGRETVRSKLALHDTVVAYFGRLTREKGVHILIKALSHLRELPWQLMMDDFDEYATGYNKEIHALLKETNIMERVVFINPSHTEIAVYMNAADVVVVPSVTVPAWKEQYGRVAAEAMACGRVVVASDSGSLPELLNNHGVIFPEGNTDALQQLLRKIITGQLNGIPVKPAETIAAYAGSDLSINRQKEVMSTLFKKNRTEGVAE